MAKTRRAYAGGAVSTTTSSAIAASGATSFTITAYTGWPSGAAPFYVVVEPGTASEEKILVTRTGASDSTINIASDAARGQDGTAAVSHGSGVTVFPVFTAVDADEANELAAKWSAKGDLVSYGSSTFEKLGVGTNDHVLTAASGEASGLKWSQVGTGSIANDAVTTAKIDDGAVTTAKISTTDYAGMGLVKVAANDFSAATSVDVTGFSSTFQMYRLVLNGEGDAGNLSVSAKLYNGATAISTGYYSAAGYANTTGGAGHWDDRDNGTEWNFANFAGLGMSMFTYDIYYTNNSERVGFTGMYFSGTSPMIYIGGSRAATTFDRIRLIAAANMSGRWRLYGYNEG